MPDAITPTELQRWEPLITGLIGMSWSRAMDEITNPQFTTRYQAVHNWRKYIPSNMQEMWNDFSVETKLALYVVAQRQADNEEWE